MRRSFVLTKFGVSMFMLVAIVAAGIISISAQSQALNGQIEGVVTDKNGAAVPNAMVTARNIETGAERKASTEDGGVYRFPLLPLGTYRITIEATNFKRLVREGVTLATGQTATIDAALEPGGLQETVTVTSDAPIADPGKIDVGRVLNNRET